MGKNGQPRRHGESAMRDQREAVTNFVQGMAAQFVMQCPQRGAEQAQREQRPDKVPYHGFARQKGFQESHQFIGDVLLLGRNRGGVGRECQPPFSHLP